MSGGGVEARDGDAGSSDAAADRRKSEEEKVEDGTERPRHGLHYPVKKITVFKDCICIFLYLFVIIWGGFA